jgi:hypothetical protein
VELPPGLNNTLAFHSSGKLLQFQIESRSAKRIPDSAVDKRLDPTVFRVRDLHGDPKKPLLEITEFDRRIEWPRASADGRVLVMVGYSNWDKPSRTIKAYETLTGKELWASLPDTTEKDELLRLALDRSGHFLTIRRIAQVDPAAELGTLVELPSGKHLGPVEVEGASTLGWSRDMPYWMDGHTGQLQLLRTGGKDPVVTLGIDILATGVQHQFSSTGTRYAWGNRDGTVNVADIPEVQRRLANIGLGWE